LITNAWKIRRAAAAWPTRGSNRSRQCQVRLFSYCIITGRQPLQFFASCCCSPALVAQGRLISAADLPRVPNGESLLRIGDSLALGLRAWPWQQPRRRLARDPALGGSDP